MRRSFSWPGELRAFAYSFAVLNRVVTCSRIFATLTPVSGFHVIKAHILESIRYRVDPASLPPAVQVCIVASVILYMDVLR